LLKIQHQIFKISFNTSTKCFLLCRFIDPDDSESYRRIKIRSFTCSQIHDTRKPYLSNVTPNTWPMSRHSNWFCLKGAADIFLRITLHPCMSWSCAMRYRAIISIRGITDVSSFHTVSTSRKLARSTLVAGWQLAPKKHRKTFRPVITVAPVLSSHYQRALARRINLIRFSGWSV